MRQIDSVFAQQNLIDKIGDSFKLLLRSSPLLLEWTEGRIFRSASGFNVPRGTSLPFIATSVITKGSRFFPNKKQRSEVICGALVGIEEPFEELETGSRTIATVFDEIERILISDPYLKIPDNTRKAERLDSIELAALDGDEDEDKVSVYYQFRFKYLTDIHTVDRTLVT